jgi:hypothetical protein
MKVKVFVKETHQSLAEHNNSIEAFVSANTSYSGIGYDVSATTVIGDHNSGKLITTVVINRRA